MTLVTLLGLLGRCDDHVIPLTSRPRPRFIHLVAFLHPSRKLPLTAPLPQQLGFIDECTSGVLSSRYAEIPPILDSAVIPPIPFRICSEQHGHGSYR